MTTTTENLLDRNVGINADESHLYLGREQAQVLAFLTAEAVHDRNIKVLISDPGMGKTVLLRAALRRMEADAQTAFLFWTQFEPDEFVAYMLKALGVSSPQTEIAAAHRQFGDILEENARRGRRVIIAIDEAQNLLPLTLQRIASLLAVEPARVTRLQIIFVGHPTFTETLDAPEAADLRARIARVVSLNPLGPEEAHAYLRQRLGKERLRTLRAAEVSALIDRSGGVPRVLDRLRDACEKRPASPVPEPLPIISQRKAREDEECVRAVREWFLRHGPSWSGTTTELARAAGAHVDGLLDVLQSHSPRLRELGVYFAVERRPGIRKMIRLQRVAE